MAKKIRKYGRKYRKAKVKYGGYVADRKGIHLRKRETAILRAELDRVEHAGGLDYDVKSRPKRMYVERGKPYSVIQPIDDDPDYEIEFHTHPLRPTPGDVGYLSRVSLSQIPSPADLNSIAYEYKKGLRERSLLVTPTRHIVEMRVVDSSKVHQISKKVLDAEYKVQVLHAEQKYRYTPPGKMIQADEEENLKFLRYFKYLWKKSVLEKYGIAIIDHKKSKDIYLDVKVKHSGKNLANKPSKPSKK